MTSNKPARLSAIHPATDEPAGGVTGAGGDRADQVAGPGHRPEGSAELIEQLRTSVLALLSGLDREPSSLRVRADQVEIAMEWPVAGTVTAAVPVAPVHVTPAAAAEGEAGGADDTGHYLTAQMVGVFYRAPEPGARPFVEEGDQVSAGQQVGIIEAMKLMIPVEADVDGRIVRVLAGNAEPVEFGAKLFEIDVAES